MAFLTARRLRWLVAAAVLALLVVLGPWLAVLAVGRSLVEDALRERFDAPVSVEGLSGGWRGVSMASLRIGQPEGFESGGAPLLEIRDVSARVHLLSLLATPSGKVRIGGASAYVIRGRDGRTNLERAMRPAPTPSPRDPKEKTPREARDLPFEGVVRLESMRVVVRDDASGTESVADPVVVTFAHIAMDHPAEFLVTAALPGRDDGAEAAVMGTVDLRTLAGNADVSATKLDLGLLEPFLASAGFVERAEGLVDASVKAKWETSRALRCDGRVVVSGLRLAGGRLAAPVADPRIEFFPHFSFDPSTSALTLDGFALQSTALRVTGKGAVDPERGGRAELSFGSDLEGAQAVFAAYLPEGTRLSGGVDGSVTLAMEPGGALRFETAVEARRVRADGAGAAAAEPTDGRVSFDGALSADRATLAIRDGTIALDPIAHGTFHATWTKRPAGGSLDGELSFDASLARAAERFAALMPAGLSLDGELSARGRAEADASGPVRFDVSARAEGLRAAAPNAGPSAPAWMRALASTPLDEPSLDVRASGTWDAAAEHVSVPSLVVKSASGALAADLSVSGSPRGLASSMAAKGTMSSRLERLASWGSPWLPAGLRLAGALDARIDLKADGARAAGPFELTVVGLVVGADAVAPSSPIAPLAGRPVRIQSLRLAATATVDRGSGSVALADLAASAEAPGGASMAGFAGSASVARGGSAFGFQGSGRLGLSPLVSALGGFLPQGASGEGNLRIDRLAIGRDGGKTTLELEGVVPKARFAWTGADGPRSAEADGTLRLRTALEELAAPGARRFDVDARATDLAVSWQGSPAMAAEPRLDFSAKGEVVPAGDVTSVRIEQARLATESRRFDASLSGSLATGPEGPTGDLQGEASGDLAFVGALGAAALPQVSGLGGRFASTFQVGAEGAATRIRAGGALTDFRATIARESGATAFEDPRVAIDVDARFDRAAGRLQVAKGSVSTASGWLALRAERVDVRGLLEPDRTAMSADGSLAIEGDLERLLALSPGALAPGARASGRLAARAEGSLQGASTGVTLHAEVADLLYAPAPQPGKEPAAPFRDAKLVVDLEAIHDRERDSLRIAKGTLSTESGVLALDANDLLVEALGGERRLSGDLAARIDGAAVGRLYADRMPEKLRLEGESRLAARLGGSAGAAPLSTLRADLSGTVSTIVFDDLRIEPEPLQGRLASGLLSITDGSGQFVKGSGADARRGRFTVNANAKIDDAEMPFAVAFRTSDVPAGRHFDVPLAYVNPIFSGSFQFAEFDGTVDGSGTLQGSASDWKSTLRGEIEADVKKVRFVARDDFAQVLSLLRLNALDSSFGSVKQKLRVGDRKIALEFVEVDGDRSKLPLVGACSLDGDLDFAVDLSRARLGKSVEPYRPILELFRPGFAGTASSPRFAVRPPTAQALLQTATKMATGSLLGGPKFDLGALTSLRSLDAVRQYADEQERAAAQPQTPPSLPVPPVGADPAGAPPGGGTPVPAVSVDAPAAEGGMPQTLGARFRALARGKGLFDYRALAQDPPLASDLAAWLQAAPPEPKSDDARLADVLNRLEVALALETAREASHPLFGLLHGKDGVHDLKGFFERSLQVAGRSSSLRVLSEEVHRLGGPLALFVIPAAAKGMPPIDRAGHDATTIRKTLETRARAFLAEHVRVNAKGQVVFPGFVYRAFDRDDAKIRELLGKWLPDDHAARPKLGGELVRYAEKLELDAP